MASDVYIVVPKLFIRRNPVRYRQIMTPMPSAHYGFLLPLHNFYTTRTTITLTCLKKPFTSWPTTTSSKFETQVVHLMYRKSHIAKDPIASFTFICSASSFGNMRATSPTNATRTSTLNHVFGIGMK
jgi:hypothetical protein